MSDSETEDVIVNEESDEEVPVIPKRNGGPTFTSKHTPSVLPTKLKDGQDFDEDDNDSDIVPDDEDDDDDDDDDVQDNDDVEGEHIHKSSKSSLGQNKSKHIKQSSIEQLVSLADDDEDEDEDEDDDEDDEEDEDYLQKFDREIVTNYLEMFHPESKVHNYDEIKLLSNITRNEKGQIVDKLHRTIPILTKFEKTRIIGLRAKQIDEGAVPFIKVPNNVIDGYTIALQELEQKVIPFIIRRPLPNGGSEYWKVSDLEIV
jgi:DNA-directed RNA polymerase subunit K/omega